MDIHIKKICEPAIEKKLCMSTENYIADAICSHFIRCVHFVFFFFAMQVMFIVYSEGAPWRWKRHRERSKRNIMSNVVRVCRFYFFTVIVDHFPCEMASSFRFWRQQMVSSPVLHFESSVLCWLCSCFFFSFLSAIQILQT